MKARHFIPSLLIAAMWCVPAAACDDTYFASKLNKRVKVGADCSFENGGKISPVIRRQHGNLQEAPNDNTHGAEAIDHSHGIVTQVISSFATCKSVEVLLVLDCNTGETTAVEGVRDTKFGTRYVSRAKYAVGPEGKVRFRRGDTIDDFVNRARSKGLNVFVDVASLQQGWKRKDRYDPFCGCKLYYPDSPGAKS